MGNDFDLISMAKSEDEYYFFIFIFLTAKFTRGQATEALGAFSPSDA